MELETNQAYLRERRLGWARLDRFDSKCAIAALLDADMPNLVYTPPVCLQLYRIHTPGAMKRPGMGKRSIRVLCAKILGTHF